MLLKGEAGRGLLPGWAQLPCGAWGGLSLALGLPDKFSLLKFTPTRETFGSLSPSRLVAAQ